MAASSPSRDQGQKPDWMAYLAEAVAKSGKPRLAEAFARARQAFGKQPAHPEVVYGLGMIAREAGRLELAAELLQRAANLAPERIGYLGDLGNVLSDMGRFDGAVACYRKVLAAMPDLALAHNNLGNTLQERGDLEEAVASLKQAVALEPGYVDAWSNLGGTLEKQGKFKEAEAALKRALAVKPDHLQARLNLGVVYHTEGLLDQAIACFTQVLADHPRSVQACNKLQKIYFEQGEFDKALALNRRLKEAAPGNQTAVCAAAFAALAHDDLDGFRRIYGADRLVHGQTLAAPEGFDDPEAFNQALCREVLAHPSLKWIHDSHDTTRRGFVYGLQERPGPVVASFIGTLRGRIDAFLKDLVAEPGHPFTGRAPRELGLNLWATILNAGGWHPAHNHETNWLSGVYYAAVPSTAESDDEAPGWIEFDGFTHLPGLGQYRDEVRRFQPTPGRLLFFPSYLMHQTRPFQGDQQRISLAFDLKPVA
ncbi:MAG: tetratricopeptide repeat protein [Pseudomonadota bacterium]